MSLHGAQRVFHVWRQTIIRWLLAYVEQLPPLPETLIPAQADDVLEFDEAWSFVEQRDNQRWLWTVLCRRTRQIVAFFIGDRSEASCRQLWQAIPEAYRAAVRTAISGGLMRLSCPRKLIIVLAKRLA